MYQGFFLNLARNEARRKSLVEELERAGATSRYQWIEAIDGSTVPERFQTKLDPGNLGLWLSQLKLLDASRASNLHVHILEDDSIFATGALQTFDAILQQADA